MNNGTINSVVEKINKVDNTSFSLAYLKNEFFQVKVLSRYQKHKFQDHEVRKTSSTVLIKSFLKE